MRLFIAFEIPREVREMCIALQHALEEAAAHDTGFRPELESDLHMTVAFLGERAPDEVRMIWAAIDEAVDHKPSSAIALTGPIAYRELERVGFLEFRDEGEGQQMWAHLNERLDALVGYQPQFPTGWLPHITVARFDRQARLDLPAPGGRRFSPGPLNLYESRPKAEVPRYRIVPRG